MFPYISVLQYLVPPQKVVDWEEGSMEGNRFTPPHARKWEAHSWMPDDHPTDTENTGTDEIGDKERAEQDE